MIEAVHPCVCALGLDNAANIDRCHKKLVTKSDLYLLKSGDMLGTSTNFQISKPKFPAIAFKSQASCL